MFGTSKSGKSKELMGIIANWLEENFELSPNSHIAREKLHQEYCDYCHRNGLTALNAASFGKSLRSVFPTVQTRRLGTRGNSKYHYNGIKPKFDQIPCISDQPRSINSNKGTKQIKKQTSSNSSSNAKSDQSTVKLGGPLVGREAPSDAWLVDSLSKLPLNSICSLPLEIGSSGFLQFVEKYKAHSRDNVKEALVGDFDKFAKNVTNFWRGLSAEDRIHFDYPVATQFVSEMDAMILQFIMSCCIPDVLQTADQELLQRFQGYLVKGPEILSRCMKGYSSEVKNDKIRVIHEMARLTAQYHVLTQVSSSTSLILQADLTPLSEAWKQVDIESIIIQSYSMCPNVHSILTLVIEAVGRKLSSAAPLPRWAEWIYELTEDCIDSNTQYPEVYLQNANQFIVRWTYVASLVMRDIDERNRHVFEQFHTLRTFIDEYMRFVIDIKYEDKKKAYIDSQDQPVMWNTVDVSSAVNNGPVDLLARVSPENPYAEQMNSGLNSFLPQQPMAQNTNNAPQAQTFNIPDLVGPVIMPVEEDAAQPLSAIEHHSSVVENDEALIQKRHSEESKLLFPQQQN